MKRRQWIAREDDRGTAVVEFIVIAVLLLIPLAYGVTSVMRVHAASQATVQAAREAGRAFITADSAGEGRARADSAVHLAFADHGFDVPHEALSIECPAGPCLAPGSSVVVHLDWRVDLPWVPAGLATAQIPIVAEHDVPVDVYRLTS